MPGNILVPVDGSEDSNRAVRFAIEMLRGDSGMLLHLLNVQPPLGGGITTFVSKADLASYYREEGEKGLASALAICAEGGMQCAKHVSVGRPGEVVAEFARRLGVKLIVMGTRGLTGLATVLMGSVARDVVAHTDIPVCLVK